jgi:SulP family sulfate permease
MAETHPIHNLREHTASTARTGGWLSHYLPILSWLPSYQRSWLRFDLTAGLTVWAVVVPEAVAYAQLAGVPAQAGLFAAPFLLLGYALFGTSRQLMVGATSASAIMLAGTVAAQAGSDPKRYAALMVGLTITIGMIVLLLGIARLGFIFGLALVIMVGQLPKLFGLPRVEGDFFQKLWQVITNLGSTNGRTLLIGVLSLALLFGLERFLPRVPASLVAVVFGILVVGLFGLNKQGVAIVGTIPAGLPTLGWPSLGLSDYLGLLPGACGVVLVLFAEHISAAQKFATKHHYDLDANQELIALGVSNFLAGLFGGFAGGGGLSKTTVNDVAGARTQISGIVSLVLVLVTLLVLTPLFYYLPEATLGAIVIHAVWGLLDVGAMRRYWRLRERGSAQALVALLGVLVFDILPGLLLAVVLSLVLLIYRASRPHGSILGKVPGKEAYGDIGRHQENETIAGLLIFRLNAPMFFANDAPLRERVKEVVHTTEPPTRTVLLDLEATSHLDLSTADMLAELAGELKEEGVDLLLANVRGPVRDLLRSSGVTQTIGEERIYPSIEEGVKAFNSTGQQIT